jgi:hypothetical protein
MALQIFQTQSIILPALTNPMTFHIQAMIGVNTVCRLPTNRWYYWIFPSPIISLRPKKRMSIDTHSQKLKKPATAGFSLCLRLFSEPFFAVWTRCFLKAPKASPCNYVTADFTKGSPCNCMKPLTPSPCYFSVVRVFVLSEDKKGGLLAALEFGYFPITLTFTCLPSLNSTTISLSR